MFFKKNLKKKDNIIRIFIHFSIYIYFLKKKLKKDGLNTTLNALFKRIKTKREKYDNKSYATTCSCGELGVVESNGRFM